MAHSPAVCAQRAALIAVLVVGAAGACSKEPSLRSPTAPQVPMVVEPSPPAVQPIDATTLEMFANLALDCIHREYPNKISHVLNSAEDAMPPSRLTPAFYGCLDWHSAVHGHWLLVRLSRKFPDASFVARARTALAATLIGPTGIWFTSMA